MSLNSDLLNGTRVRLTALTKDDLPTVVQWHQDPLFLRMFDSRVAMPKTPATLATWLEEQHKANDAFVFAIRSHADELLGYIEIEGIAWAHGTAWLAYCIGEAAQRGKGYATEAVQLALQFVFHELNLHRIQATVFSYNQPSMRLLQKLGFQREGTYREFLHRDGQRYDMHLYGLLRREWEASG